MALITRSNPLVYPAGAVPGFNNDHPAMRSAASAIAPFEVFSIVPAGNNFIDLNTSTMGTLTNAPTAKVVPMLGPSVNFGSTARIDFTRVGSATTSAMTGAAILQFDTVSGFQVIIGDTSLIALLTAQSGTPQIYNNGAISSALPAMVVNTPYFYVASASVVKNIVNFVYINLRTGAMQYATAALVNNFASTNNSQQVGNNGTTQGTKGSIAAAMHSSGYTELSDLIAWAKDPWSFWYPPVNMPIVAAAAVVTPAFIAPIQSAVQGQVEMIGY